MFPERSAARYAALLIRGPSINRPRLCEAALRADAVIKSGERKHAKVAKPLPLYWVDVTARATPDGVVQFREDSYNRDGIS